jgi:hypothetical protein
MQPENRKGFILIQKNIRSSFKELEVILEKLTAFGINRLKVI